MKNTYIKIMIISIYMMFQSYSYSSSIASDPRNTQAMEIDNPSIAQEWRNQTDIQEQNNQAQAMDYFRENVLKNQAITRNINLLMNERQITSIHTIIHQSYQLNQNKDVINNALKSTLKALNAAISDVQFDAYHNANFFSRFMMKYVYTNPVELQLIQMQQQVQRRLNEDDLQSIPEKALKKISSYSYLTTKVAVSAAALMAVLYAGLHYNDTKQNIHEFVNTKTIGDLLIDSSKTV